MAEYRHYLGIGATGMLGQASTVFAARSVWQTLVARHASAFAARGGLANAVGVDADWHDTPAYLAAVEEAIARSGPVDFCLLWLHGDARAVLPGLLRLLGEGGHGCRLIQVLGSSRADPRGQADAVRVMLENYPSIRYHTVALGSVVEDGTRRWLTHAEIVEGVLVCEHEARDVVVGEVGTVG